MTLLMFSLMGLACAFAWNFESMLTLRFVQGIGLGGEVPVMITYINEFSKAAGRGRFALGIQVLFAVGLVGSALLGVWVVPTLGWQWMFIIGALPAILALPLRRLVPESPRWLASKGRFDDADRVLRRIEAIAERNGKTCGAAASGPARGRAGPLPLGDLFRGIYLKRTLTAWCLWICSFGLSYGIGTWAAIALPLAVPPAAAASAELRLHPDRGDARGTLITVFTIDAVGRKPLFVVGLLGTALPLLSFLVMDASSAATVLVRISITYFFLSTLVLALGMYTAEIYPNSMRALGSGVSAAWQRAAATAGPLVVATLLPGWGLDAVFVFFGCVASVGFAVCMLFMIETRGRVLERLSPNLRR